MRKARHPWMPFIPRRAPIKVQISAFKCIQVLRFQAWLFFQHFLHTVFPSSITLPFFQLFSL
jgi:hypothetical protein